MPGSWDVPVKKWVMGAGMALVLAWYGVGDVFAAACNVPIYHGRFSGFEWMRLEGVGARWYGMCLVACALGLNARFFWRFHRNWWRYYEPVQNFGAGLAALSLTITYIYLWKAHF